LQSPPELDIARTAHFDEGDNDSVVFLFDRSKKGIDIVTEKHFEAGYKVFAFRLNSVKKIDLYHLSMTVITLWPKILKTLTIEPNPFIFTYSYSGTTLKKFDKFCIISGLIIFI
jgi:hypothetical protein